MGGDGQPRLMEMDGQDCLSWGMEWQVMSGYLIKENLSAVVTDGWQHLMLVRRSTTVSVLVRGFILTSISWKDISWIGYFLQMLNFLFRYWDLG